MFSRLFYDSNFYPNNISKFQFFVSILLGLTSAIILYSFFCVLDDVYKVLEIGFSDLPNLVSENQKYKSNLFYAGISLIIGNSVCISYLFSRPSSVFHIKNPKRRRILNDQVFLGANFTHWFLRIGVTFGVFASFGFNFKAEVFYYPLMVLIFFVLYLDIWKSLLQILKKNRYKILLFHFLCTILLIFALAKFDVTSYKKVEESALRNNPVVNLPFSDYGNENIYHNYINIKLKLDNLDQLVIFTRDNELVNISEFNDFIKEMKTWKRVEVLQRITVNILADANLKLHYIKELEAVLFINNISRVNYATSDGSVTYNQSEFNKIFKRISPDVLKIEIKRTGIEIPFPHLLPPFIEEDRLRFSDSLLINVNEDIRLNGISTSKKILKKTFKNKINASTYFRYLYDKNSTYQDYIDVLTAHYSAIEELRIKEQKDFMIYPYSSNTKGFGTEAFKAERRRLMDMYPLTIREEYKN